MTNTERIIETALAQESDVRDLTKTLARMLQVFVDSAKDLCNRRSRQTTVACTGEDCDSCRLLAEAERIASE